eukprot:2952992-Amphidinium_carterae.1
MGGGGDKSVIGSKKVRQCRWLGSLVLAIREHLREAIICKTLTYRMEHRIGKPSLRNFACITAFDHSLKGWGGLTPMKVALKSSEGQAIDLDDEVH